MTNQAYMMSQKLRINLKWKEENVWRHVNDLTKNAINKNGEGKHGNQPSKEESLKQEKCHGDSSYKIVLKKWSKSKPSLKKMTIHQQHEDWRMNFSCCPSFAASVVLNHILCLLILSLISLIDININKNVSLLVLYFIELSPYTI